jgi:hypothetical protein
MWSLIYGGREVAWNICLMAACFLKVGGAALPPPKLPSNAGKLDMGGWILIMVESNVTVEDTCGGCDTNEVHAHRILEQRCEVL